jgi:putative membrane protein
MNRPQNTPLDTVNDPLANPDPEKNSHYLKLLGGIIGLGIVVYLFYSIGWAEIYEHLSTLGWFLPLVFLPYFFTNIINTYAWISSFPPPFSKYNLKFFQVYWIRICGESINNFTPTAQVGGEVSRVLFLKKFNVSSTTGMVTVIMDKAALVISQILFIYTGLFMLLSKVDWSLTIKVLIGSTLILALIVIYGILLAVHKGFFSRISLSINSRFRWPALRRLHKRIKTLDHHLMQFYFNHHKEFIRSNYLHYIGWIIGALETWTLLYLLGQPVSIADAIMIESLVGFAKGIGFLIPGSLGIMEGGSVFLFQTLGLGSGLGLAFTLLKRTRELFFGGLGWVVLYSQFPSLKENKSPSSTD